LAQIFKELGIIEKYGAGVKRVIEDFKAYGLVEPTFEEKFGGFYVVVSDGKLKKGTTQEISNNINGFGATTQETTQEIEATTQEIALEIEATTQEIKTTTQKITQEIIERIIRLIEENPKLSRRAMAELKGRDAGLPLRNRKPRPQDHSYGVFDAFERTGGAGSLQCASCATTQWLTQVRLLQLLYRQVH
jgi:hypothetical protein